MVDSCLHCKFRNGAWRPRAAFQDKVLSFEDRIIYIDIDVTLKLGVVLLKLYTFVAHDIRNLPHLKLCRYQRLYLDAVST